MSADVFHLEVRDNVLELQWHQRGHQRLAQPQHLQRVQRAVMIDVVAIEQLICCLPGPRKGLRRVVQSFYSLLSHAQH